MNVQVGMRLIPKRGSGGYTPHFLEGQEYSVVKVKIGGRFIIDRCSSGNQDCVCQITGWFWDEKFELFHPVLLVGDKVFWVKDTSPHFVKDLVKYTVKSITKDSLGQQQFTVVECEVLKQGVRCPCGEGRMWVYNEDFVWSESEVQFTDDEIKKANTLPTPNDVASFFRVRL